MKDLILSLLFTICLLASQSVYAKTYVIKGEQTVWFEITNPEGVMDLPTYKSYSFSQEVVEDGKNRKVVKVYSLASQFNSSVEYPIPDGWLFENSTPYLVNTKKIQKDDPQIKKLAQKLVKGKKNEFEAVVAIINWVGDNIEYDKSLRLPVDAVSVYLNKKAKCTGYSNFTCALLRSLGIPAREWIGYLPPQSKWTVRKGEGVLHAWVEVFYPDAGWVLYDPQVTHHFLDPFHILLQISGDGMNAIKAKWGSGEIETVFGTKIKIIKQEDKTELVDVLPEPERDVYARQLWEQKFSVLLGKVVDEKDRPVTEGIAYRWQGDDAKGQKISRSGEFALYGLEPGKVKYSVTAPGFKEVFREIEVNQKDVYHAAIKLERGSVLKGVVKKADGSFVLGGEVVVYDKKTEMGMPYKIASDGTYVADREAPGEYIITVELDDVELMRTEYTIKDGANILNLTVN